jgi:phage terminase Nu1 subunit (DNA packaging protein)
LKDAVVILISKGGDKVIVDKRGLCEFLQIHFNTVDRYMAKGMPILKADKLVRFDTDEVVQWMRECALKNKKEEE